MKSIFMRHRLSTLAGIIILIAIAAVVSVAGGDVEEIAGMITPTLVALLALLKGEQTEQQLKNELKDKEKNNGS